MNRLTKLFAMFVATLAVALGLGAGTALAATETDFVGEWTMTQYSTGGKTYTPEQVGKDILLTINKDGTLIINADGTEADYTWTYDSGDTAYISSKDATVKEPLTIAGDILTLDETDDVITFARNSSTAAAVGSQASSASVSAATSAATTDLAGDWYLKSMSDGTQTIDAASLGDTTYIITFSSDGTGSIDTGDTPLAFTWTQNGDSVTLKADDGSTIMGTLSGSDITLTQDGYTLVFSKGDAASTAPTAAAAASSYQLDALTVGGNAMKVTGWGGTLVSLSLADDGTGTFTYFGSTKNITWEATDNGVAISSDEDVFTFTMQLVSDGDDLVLDDTDCNFGFTLVPVA